MMPLPKTMAKFGPQRNQENYAKKNKNGRQVFETVHLGNNLVILFFNGLSEVKPEREEIK